MGFVLRWVWAAKLKACPALWTATLKQSHPQGEIDKGAEGNVFSVVRCGPLGLSSCLLQGLPLYAWGWLWLPYMDVLLQTCPHAYIGKSCMKMWVYLPSRIRLPIQETRVQSWVKKIPWRREWLPTLVFFPGESHGQKSLAGYSPWGCKQSGHDLATKPQQQ